MQEASGNYEYLGRVIDVELNSFNSLTHWLKEVKILPEGSHLISYNELGKWLRSGGETYSCCAKIDFSLNRKFQVKLINYKAIVSLNSQKAFLDWKRRRNILMENNIPVSNWYYAKEAIIIEDFYENSIKNVKNIYEIESIGKKLDFLGFNCLNYLADIRCNKYGEAFYIDFGFDLGEPNKVSSNFCNKLFKNYINSIEDGKNIITN